MHPISVVYAGIISNPYPYLGLHPICVETLASGVAWVSRLWYLPVGYLFPNRGMIVAQPLSLCKRTRSLISNYMCIYRGTQAIALSHPF